MISKLKKHVKFDKENSAIVFRDRITVELVYKTTLGTNKMWSLYTGGLY